ncbi:helix-turn-helix transcriptional regulator [Variovorax paradoxus]|uniref:helix-turn-helix transcriptional regulator n=1 Tax=Variovorax paradoxus TaxID=34073 RepID=UPI0009EB5E7A
MTNLLQSPACELPTNSPALLRCPAVVALVGLSRSEIYRRMAAGTFPRPVKLGPRCSRWRAQEIGEWLEELASIR